MTGYTFNNLAMWYEVIVFVDVHHPDFVFDRERLSNQLTSMAILRVPLATHEYNRLLLIKSVNKTFDSTLIETSFLNLVVIYFSVLVA